MVHSKYSVIVTNISKIEYADQTDIWIPIVYLYNIYDLNYELCFEEYWAL